MTKNRAKNIDDQAIRVILGVLDGWSGKLTWELLIDAIEQRIHVCYTRQALDRHTRIKMAYQAVKNDSVAYLLQSKVGSSQPLMA